MSEQLTPEQEKAIKAVSEAVASALAEGRSKEKVVKDLVKQDWPEVTAIEFVDRIEQEVSQYRNSPEWRQTMARGYARHMLYGLLWACGGTVFTIVTYVAALSRPSGGVYFVAWGAIVFGVIDFCRGLVGWLKYRG
ncbi:MAG: hypothetical protein GTO12_06055 [Proteobacteria bacterium]|nr:hypothetical protein [Pseudomonadota bacterium]